MSRIGKKPVLLPPGVEVRAQQGVLEVRGPKGELKMDVPSEVTVTVEGDRVLLQKTEDNRKTRAMHGLARALTQNMVVGVSQGFEKQLLIEGVGYQARVEGNKLVLVIGFCHDVEMEIPQGLEVEIPQRTKTIIIRGIDKQLVGQFAANVRRVRPPEPYKGKGIRYSDETVRRKAGKAQVGTGA
jgi:large subunit ribosomal protein L6